jgi:hypothetical protein
MHKDFRKCLAQLIGRISEEGIVCASALFIQGIGIYTRAADRSTTLLLFAALGSYLTLRLLRVFGLPKD